MLAHPPRGGGLTAPPIPLAGLTIMGALLAGASMAGAHTETVAEWEPLIAGPYHVVLQPVPSPLYANGNVTIHTLVTGAQARAVGARVNFNVTGPLGFSAADSLVTDERGIASFAFFAPVSGDHELRIGVVEGDAIHANRSSLHVYPDHPYRIWAADAIPSDPVVGRPYRVAIAVVDHVTQDPALDVKDVRARVERWDAAHANLLSTEEVAMRHEGLGTWSAMHTFETRGMYHIQFASDSGGFVFGELPAMHLNAKSPPAGVSRSQTPGAPLAWLLAGVGSVAVAARPRRA